MTKKYLPKTEFSRNVLTLMSGTILAQAIPIAISPILTRLYSPDNFGVFALFASLSAILSIISTGRYELAIILPEEDDDAKNLAILALGILFIFNFILFVVFILFGQEIVTLLGNKKIENWLLLVPVSIFLTGIYQIMRLMRNRFRNYKEISLSKIYGSSATAASRVLLGDFFSGFSGLILSQLIGQLGLLTKIFSFNYLKPIKLCKHDIAFLAKKYSNYPKVDIPSSLLNSLAQQGPNLFFTPLFGAATTGYYFLIQRVLMMPITLISTSIAEVFREESVRQFKDKGRFDAIFISTFKKLFFIAIVFFPTFALVSEELFSFVFGSKWRIAGRYAAILTPMFMCKFVVSPLTYSIYVKNKLRFDLYGQFFLLLSLVLSVVLGYYLRSSMVLIVSLSISFSVVYIFYFFVSYRLAK